MEDAMSDNDLKAQLGAIEVPTTFVELDELDQARAIRNKFGLLADEFLYLSRNVLFADDVPDKSAAIADLSREFTERLATLDTADKAIEKATWSTAKVNDFPDSSFLYVESGGEKDAEGKTTPRSLRHFPVKDADGKPDPAHLRNALARAGQAKDKSGKPLSDAIVKRVQTKARELLKKATKETGFWQSVVRRAKERAGLVESDKVVDSPFFVWKDAGTDRFWWFAVYSNNYKDDDRPPEIISADAHREFVKNVDGGRWPMPELWLWHVPGSKVGRAKMVAFDDDTGFAVAAGTFDPGRENIAGALMESKGILVSHGMPGGFIERDADDPSTIVRYRTREISPLPDWAAANKATGFTILNTKEYKDMLPKEKRAFLEGLGIDVDVLDGQLKDAAELLADAGIPSKEVESEETPEATPETVDAATTEDPTDADEKDAGDPAPEDTTDETPELTTAQIVAAAVQVGVESAMESVVGSLKSVNDRLDAIEAREKETDELSPAASFQDVIRSAVIGQDAAKIDGRKKDAQGPVENKAVTQGDTPFDVVNAIKAGQDWRGAIPAQ
jgi:hypothetical protein